MILRNPSSLNLNNATTQTNASVDPRSPLITTSRYIVVEVPEPVSAQESSTRQAGRAGKARHSEYGLARRACRTRPARRALDPLATT